MSLKEQINADINNIFMQTDDFAEEHEIEGQNISIVPDLDRLSELKSGGVLGVVKADYLFFANTADLPEEKGPGETINIDGKEYIVDDWSINYGMAQIACHQERMR
jgi:hypothetical protein